MRNLRNVRRNRRNTRWNMEKHKAKWKETLTELGLREFLNHLVRSFQVNQNNSRKPAECLISKLCIGTSPF